MATFHERHPGITEALLSRSRNDAQDNPYEWAARRVTNVETVLDVGCGNAPMAPRLANWVGLDLSEPELDLARSSGRTPLVCGHSDALPMADGSVSTVLAVMSLMVVDDPARTLLEAARVMRSGGVMVIVLPAHRPVKIGDVARFGSLLAVLGRPMLPFPHPEVSQKLQELLGGAGLELTEDVRSRFEYSIAEDTDADLLIESLYLPGVPHRRVRAARAVARRWVGRSVGLPLRRVVARKVDGSRARRSRM